MIPIQTILLASFHVPEQAAVSAKIADDQDKHR